MNDTQDPKDRQDRHRQFLRGFQARPGDRARNAAHRDGRRREPVHRAVRLALRRAVVRRLRPEDRLSAQRRSTICSSSTSSSARPCPTSRGTPSPISAMPSSASSPRSIPATRSPRLSKVIGVKENSNKKSGTVYVRSTGKNQRGQPVLSYARWVMVNKRDVDAPAPAPVVPDLAASVEPATLGAALPPLDLADYDYALAGSPKRWGDYAGRRQDRPCRRPDHRGGRAPARHAPVPEHRAGAFQSACRGQGPVRPPPRLWRPHHLDRAEPELQRARQRLPYSRAERRAPRGAVLRRRHHLCLERGARQSRAAGPLATWARSACAPSPSRTAPAPISPG